MDTQTTPQNSSPDQSTERTKSISIPAAILTGAVIIALAIVLVLSPKKQAVTPSPTQPSLEVPTEVLAIRPDDHIRGDLATAEVAIIEYSDSDCPYCATFHKTLTDITAAYTGKVAWVYRYFPLDMHPNAYPEALALECVSDLGGATAFNTYLDKIMGVTLNGDPTATLVDYAKAQGLDTALFASCMKNTDTAAVVDADIAEAKAIGAQGTPYSVIVNIKTGKYAIVPGAYPIEEVRKQIDTLLK